MKPNHALLDEYGLSEYLYDALKACEYPTFWKQGDLTHSIACLYKLRNRGLLTGPPTGSPYSVPFSLSPTGRDLLGRLARGLHRPEWLTFNRKNALGTLVKNGGALIYSPKNHGSKFTRTTLDSLARHGYVHKDFEQWRITDLGREAWAEWQGRESTAPARNKN